MSFTGRLARYFFFALGAGLGIPSEPSSSKVRLIVLLSNRMTSGIHAHSDSGVGIVILREFRDLEKLLLNMSTLTI